MPLEERWWERADDYPGMGPRCVCGHVNGSHVDDTGACRRGHYGPFGRYVGGGCPCVRFRDDRTTRQTDLLDELLAP